MLMKIETGLKVIGKYMYVNVISNYSIWLMEENTLYLINR